MAKTDTHPFIKWAGGKTQLMGVIGELLPGDMDTYYEPFLGGGAPFWHMSMPCRYKRAVLNDWNAELVNTYEIVRSRTDDLIRALSDHMALEWNTREYFNRVRAMVPAEMDPVARAARFIYLNKTCYNGLYRVNKSGQFNAPFGDYENPSLFEVANLRSCSKVLGNAELNTGDFTKVLGGAKRGDVVYFDPPYVPLNATADFTSYTSDGFGIADQTRLSICFKNLAEKGVVCVLSNSDTAIVRALYEEFEILSVKAKRNINSKAGGRGPVGEVIVLANTTRRRDTLDDLVLDELPLSDADGVVASGPVVDEHDLVGFEPTPVTEPGR